MSRWAGGAGAIALVVVNALPGFAQPSPLREPASLEVPPPPLDLTRPPRSLPGAEKLPPKYRRWLVEVDLLITDPELTAFLGLAQDYERDAFILEFWQVRDPDPATPRNEARERHESSLVEAEALFGSLADVRARVMQVLGPADERFEVSCGGLLWPTEAWFYAEPRGYRQPVALLFLRKWGAGFWRLWDGHEGPMAFYRDDSVGGSAVSCNFEKFQIALRLIGAQGLQYLVFLHDVEKPPKREQNEWVETFASYSTSVPTGAATAPASLELRFPGWHGRRTVVEGSLVIATTAAGVQQLAGHTSYNFVLNGEVLRGTETADEQLFERFRYRFDLPASQVGEKIELRFQRYLRAEEEVTLRLRLEDLSSGTYFPVEHRFVVPRVETAEPSARAVDAESARLEKAADRAMARGETTLQLVRPMGDLLTGMVRFDTMILGEEVRKVIFTLDGEPSVTKAQPPFSLELDLGALPRARTLSAVAVDAAGRELARDDLAINAGGHRFRIRLIEPRSENHTSQGLRALATVEVPDGEQLERVEFYIGGERGEFCFATLYSPPWAQPLSPLDAMGPSFVRAVAVLAGDGGSVEDVSWVNAPAGFGEAVEVDLVELYASVVDRHGRPVTGLEEADFLVAEEGATQTLVRFEAVGNLPVQLGILLDISASMAAQLSAAKGAVLGILERLTEPHDRLALIPFNDRPYLATRLTRSAAAVGEALAGLRVERGTALYDSVIFGLFYFNGLGGQRAMLVVSDGEDESSRFDFDAALEMARRSGVSLYTIGIGLGDGGAARRLARLAAETGGRAFTVTSASELPAAYDAILSELRARYLLVYQSPESQRDERFRAVEVRVSRRGLEVRAPQGYYP